MSDFKVQPNGCKSEACLKRHASSIKSTKMETFYGSIISTMLESLRAAK
jgi:hypothetical protein